MFLERRLHARLVIRPQDRYADGRESARILQALANHALTVADIAKRAQKDVDATRALICALRRQGKIRVERREWRPIQHRDGHERRRQLAIYVRAYIPSPSQPDSFQTSDHGLSA